MEEWRCVTLDSHPLKSGENKFQLFSSEGPNYIQDRATKRIESDIVKWIFTKHMENIPFLIYEEIGISNLYKHYLECRKYILDNEYHESDIDILLFNEKFPNLSIAFQVKRITVSIDENGKSSFKRIHEIEEGIKQANKLYKKYKFYKNYLMTIVIIDGRNKKDVNQIFRQPDSIEMYDRIYFSKNFGGLHEDIGIFAYEIIQPTNENIDYRATVASKELKRARQIEQSSLLTERILQHVKWANDK